MPVKVITTEFGHSMPPESPHNVTVHAKGWDTGMRFREGDPTVFARLQSIYPRFLPLGLVKELSAAVGQKLKLPDGHGCLLFTAPEVFGMAKAFALSPHRQQLRLAPHELLFRVADVRGVRLYAVAYPLARTPGVLGLWQNAGIGISSRLAEELLPYAAEIKPLDFAATGEDDVSVEKVPTPTYLPETEVHGKLRERIVELLRRAPVDPAKAMKVEPDDVYLYGTGMAAIHYLHEAIMDVREGTLVGLGSLFHNTWHVFEESPHGYKHFGPCDANGGVTDSLEAYLRDEAGEGRKISYVFVEFPSNPILVSVDLYRLKELADKYDFILVVDDTVGSFSNIDVLPVADVVMTSTTKSLSGYANVMGGSLVLNPSSPRYEALKATLQRHHRNEVFAGDAAQLLANSADYLARSTVLNRNAAALATYLQTQVADPASPVTAVLYPPLSDTRANYEAFMRPPTADFTPGYGCLLSVEFEDKAVARIFYDALEVYNGPHLGAHHTLAMPFNEIVWGREADREMAEYHRGFGVKGEQIRVSVGLESVEEILDTFKAALVRAEEERASRKDGV